MLPQRSGKKTARITVRRASVDPEKLPTLQVLRNEDLLQTLPFDVHRILVGRAEENHVAIPSNFVSRYHFMLLRHGDSTILIDLNSTNGTFVNSKRVYSRVLVDGDVISVDTHSMFVQYNLRYVDPNARTGQNPGEVESVEDVIAKAVQEVAALIGREDTDLLPVLSENTPTEIGFVDDR